MTKDQELQGTIHRLFDGLEISDYTIIYNGETGLTSFGGGDQVWSLGALTVMADSSKTRLMSDSTLSEFKIDRQGSGKESNG